MSSLTRNTLAQSVLNAVRGKQKASRAEGEEPENPEEENDTSAEEQDISPDAEEPDDDTSAETDETDPDAEGGDDDTEAEGDDGEEDKQMSRKASARIRKVEQSRIKSILTHPKAEANHGLAMELAFGKTFYSAETASALLNSSSGSGPSLSSRMAGKSPKLGSGGSGQQATGKQAVLASVGKTIQALHGRNKKEA
ncbi:hypothetical protein FY136_00745 [Agrobacterium tumefaciens]|uniref:hypothetical protein n=1 Tax=Agrobacterium tumefaciens TaxID=358 RepID=UPI0021CFC8C2|nr:hypothetical protein [Agrobacterium tumefaciens]UXT47836.1 hypothetical protein FY136_00745 [Agrobacterium tumefaciens]